MEFFGPVAVVSARCGRIQRLRQAAGGRSAMLQNSFAEKQKLDRQAHPCML